MPERRSVFFMKADIENKLLAVVRVRGRVGVRQSISETLKRLNLRYVNNLAVLYGSKSNIGMIRKCNDFITYGEISGSTLSSLLERKGVKLSQEDLKQVNEGKKSLGSLVDGPLRMHPPRRGYESTKRGYSAGGALGYRGREMEELINRML
ncbi:MAG: uL30 family ribosomal protein [Candidatus Marsarchaeota archaeon]|nr:uL30 family ribosomal protein [Candidatus Marsarchaeota archaeon]